MPRSLSILTLSAAFAMTGAAYAQDTTAEGAEEAADAATEATGAAAEAAADAATTATAADDAAGTEAADTETAAPAEGAADAEDGAADDGAAKDGDPAFSTGSEVGADQQPAVYIKEQFGDWNLRCFRNDDGEDPCQLYQLLREAGGNPVAEFSVFRIENQAPAVAGATAIVPLITLLTEELKISVDGGTAKSYPYRVCTEAGCVAQIGLTAQDVAAFKKGSKAEMVLVPAQAPDQKVRINVSLSGFTAGYEAVGAFTE